MSPSEKIIGDPVFKKSEYVPASRLSAIGLLLAYTGTVLIVCVVTTAGILNLADHIALSQQIDILVIYPFALVLLGILVGLVLPIFVYKNVDPSSNSLSS